jgi:hypothetical protein
VNGWYRGVWVAGALQELGYGVDLLCRALREKKALMQEAR